MSIASGLYFRCFEFGCSLRRRHFVENIIDRLASKAQDDALQREQANEDTACGKRDVAPATGDLQGGKRRVP